MSGGNDEGHHDGGGKKRANDGGGDYGSPQKKQSFVADPESVYLKFLVPQATAGSVIGKGGQNISELQKEYGVHIRMSKANDTFPGTDFRVAIMSGKIQNVLSATMLIFKRMTSPSDLYPKNPRPKTVSDRELSLVVPQSTAGLIIGKGGSRVKSIQEETKCHINLTQKDELDLPTQERVVTIQNKDADPDNIEKALKLILEIIKGDPGSGSCLTINYTNSESHHHYPPQRGGGDDSYNEDPYEGHKGYGNSGGRNWNRGNPGGMGMGMDKGDRDRSGNGAGLGMPLAPGLGGGGLSANSSSFSTASGYPPQVHFWCTFSGPPISNGHTPPPHMIEGMKNYLLNVGFPVKAIQEIIAACNLLASYGVLKPGNITIFNTPQPSVNPFSTMGTEAIGGIGGGMGPGGVGGLDGWNNNAMGAFMKQFQQATGGGGGNRGYDYDGGFESNNYGMGGGMGGGGALGGMNPNAGGGGGYGKNDMNDVLKRRF